MIISTVSWENIYLLNQQVLVESHLLHSITFKLWDRELKSHPFFHFTNYVPVHAKVKRNLDPGLLLYSISKRLKSGSARIIEMKLVPLNSTNNELKYQLTCASWLVSLLTDFSLDYWPCSLDYTLITTKKATHYREMLWSLLHQTYFHSFMKCGHKSSFLVNSLHFYKT